MTAAMPASAGVRDAIASLPGLDRALQGGVEDLTGEQAFAALRELEQHRRRQAAVDAALIAVLDSSGLPQELGCRSTAALLAQVLRIDPGEASGRVRAATELGARRALTGQRLDPVYPVTADALAAGEISAAHARIITTTVEALPSAVAAHEPAVEAQLVEQARRFAPRQLGRTAALSAVPDAAVASGSQRHSGPHLDRAASRRARGHLHIRREETDARRPGHNRTA